MDTQALALHSDVAYFLPVFTVDQSNPDPVPTSYAPLWHSVQATIAMVHDCPGTLLLADHIRPQSSCRTTPGSRPIPHTPILRGRPRSFTTPRGHSARTSAQVPLFHVSASTCADVRTGSLFSFKNPNLRGRPRRIAKSKVSYTGSRPRGSTFVKPPYDIVTRGLGPVSSILRLTNSVTEVQSP